MKKIILLDDSNFAIRHMEYILDKKYALRGVSSIEEALEVIQKEQFDLLLVDYLLPVGDGLQFVQRARALPQYKDIPVILISASLDKVLFSEALRSGVNDCLCKPIKRRETMEVIEQMLAKPYVRSLDREVDVAECLSWEDGEAFYQYSPQFRQLVQGATDAEASAKMKEFLSERFRAEGKVVRVRRVKTVHHILERQ